MNVAALESGDSSGDDYDDAEPSGGDAPPLRPKKTAMQSLTIAATASPPQHRRLPQTPVGSSEAPPLIPHKQPSLQSEYASRSEMLQRRKEKEREIAQRAAALAEDAALAEKAAKALTPRAGMRFGR